MKNFLVGTLLFALPLIALATLSNNQIKIFLIQKSILNYLSTIGNCPCPYNQDKAGRLCGKRSAWSRTGGYSPLCYSSDVTNQMIEDYKKSTK